jgi:hypothetical protein
MGAPFQQDAATVRRTLAANLTNYLDTQSSKDALQLWVQDFESGDNTLSALGRWCREISKRFNFREREAELYLKVFNALQTPAGAAAGDSGIGERSRAGVSSTNASAHPSAKLLMAFCAALGEQANHEASGDANPATLRRAWIAQAKSLASGPQKAAVAWWSGHSSQLAGNWSAGNLMTEFINVTYVGLLDLLGPVAADRCFSNAVRQLENSDDPALRAIRQHL